MNCGFLNVRCEDVACDLCEKIATQSYNKALDDYMDALKNEWTLDAILCATDKHKLIAIFKRLEEGLKSEIR